MFSLLVNIAYNVWGNQLKTYQILWRLYNKQMTRCDNRNPQTVNKGREQQISFSCTFVFFAIFSPFSILFSSLWMYSIYLFSPLFIQTTTFHGFHGWGLSTGWHLSSLLQDKVNFLIILHWLYFFFFCSFVPDS